MLWWQWIVVGICLLGAEMMVDADFYLVFLGVSAVVVGLVDLAWAGSPIWGEWLLFSGVAIASLLLFRSRLHAKLRGSTAEISGSLVGDVGVVEAEIEPGGMGRITLRGTTWTARNVEEGVLPENARVRVDAVSGVIVDVRKAEH